MHNSCPKCGAGIAGGSKTCGSCGSVSILISAFVQNVASVYTYADLVPDLPELEKWQDWNRKHLAMVWMGNFTQRRDEFDDRRSMRQDLRSLQVASTAWLWCSLKLRTMSQPKRLNSSSVAPEWRPPRHCHSSPLAQQTGSTTQNKSKIWQLFCF